MTAATSSLAQALKLTESDLGLVLEHRSLLLPQHLHPRVLEVWPEIRERIEELRAQLLEAPNSIDDKLARYGLTGAQLELKLQAHRTASDRAHKARPPIGFRKIFESLLGWINVWLGSLVAAMGAGEAIKEFKEVLEQGVKDAEDLG
jgi:hypothetical protein